MNELNSKFLLSKLLESWLIFCIFIGEDSKIEVDFSKDWELYKQHYPNWLLKSQDSGVEELKPSWEYYFWK